jgi:lipid-A-disaccharide synthase
MEPPIYARHGVDARFVGHPMADAMPLDPDRAAARARFGLPMHAPVLALLPGSRLGEVPAANAGCRAILERQPGAEGALLLDGQARAAMEAADVVLLASGTAALEAMLAKRPMVVGHRIAPLTHALVRRLGLLKSRFVSLPNILAGEALAPELLQDDCTPERLASAVLHWFEQPEAAAALRPRFRAIHETLRRDASATAADAVVDLLEGPR